MNHHRLLVSFIVAVAPSAMAARCLGLVTETPTPEVAALPAEMVSSKLSVQFDAQTHRARTIVNRESNDTLTLVPESAFRLEMDKLEGTAVPAEFAQQRPAVTVDARDCQIIPPSRDSRPQGA